MNYKISDFTYLKKIGEGTYGVVYKCINNITNELKAIKKIKSDNDEDGLAPTTLREISILQQLVHPNIVHLEQTINTDGKIYMIFEYLNMDLRKYLDEFNASSNTVKRLAYQMMQGLLFCHTKGFMHRDLKPQNLLIDTEKMIVKLADFGLARKFSAPIKELTHEVVTLWYRSPEILLNTKRYSCAIDVWSIGCIIPEIATGVPLFQGDTEISQLFKIFEILGTPNIDIWPNIQDLSGWNKMFPLWNSNLGCHFKDIIEEPLLDLLMKLLTFNPAKRINIRDALSHRYFNDLDKSNLPGKDFENLSIPSFVHDFYKVTKFRLA